MPPEAINQRTSEVEQWGSEICQDMTKAIQALGFTDVQIPTINFSDADFALATDPFTQKQALKGIWYGANQLKVGEIIFQVDGSFYAEYDVVQPHPTDKRWFVEAITAWGQEGNIKTDASLLPAQGA